MKHINKNIFNNYHWTFQKHWFCRFDIDSYTLTFFYTDSKYRLNMNICLPKRVIQISTLYNTLYTLRYLREGDDCPIASSSPRERCCRAHENILCNEREKSENFATVLLSHRNLLTFFNRYSSQTSNLNWNKDLEIRYFFLIIFKLYLFIVKKKVKTKSIFMIFHNY